MKNWKENHERGSRLFVVLYLLPSSIAPKASASPKQPLMKETPVKSRPRLSSGGLDQILKDVSDIEKQLMELDLNESDHETRNPIEEPSQQLKKSNEQDEKKQVEAEGG